MPWKLIWETQYEIFVPMLVRLWRSSVWKGKNPRVQVFVTQIRVDTILLEVAQEPNCETSILLDPKLEPKLWKNIQENKVKILKQEIWIYIYI
jgi:hypothetical protein